MRLYEVEKLYMLSFYLILHAEFMKSLVSAFDASISTALAASSKPSFEAEMSEIDLIY